MPPPAWCVVAGVDYQRLSFHCTNLEWMPAVDHTPGKRQVVLLAPCLLRRAKSYEVEARISTVGHTIRQFRLTLVPPLELSGCKGQVVAQPDVFQPITPALVSRLSRDDLDEIGRGAWSAGEVAEKACRANEKKASRSGGL